MKMIKYDITKDFLLYNVWKSDESFPIKKINENSKIKELQNFEIREYLFEGMRSNRNQNNFISLLNDFKNQILAHILNQRRNVFLFGLESESNVISKIRSYKGLIDRQVINSELFIQKEQILSNNQSRFAFVARIKENNFDYLSRFFFDYTNSFIITTHNDYLNNKFIDDICFLQRLEGWTHIDLLNIMLVFCPQGDILYRIGGNDGEDYWSLQEFVKKEF
ncbi:hypothetical protein [Flectobacillus major]|uniref:hypothetical protein n=1 Tax=Flectobacillus major TaxID=103 RepID=UPI000428B756|nr:hypothetical protein [Flectobacillus major]